MHVLFYRPAHSSDCFLFVQHVQKVSCVCLRTCDHNIKHGTKKVLPWKLSVVSLQEDERTREEEETSSPQPEPVEEEMETTQPEPSEDQEPEKDAEADVAAPDTGSGSEDVEWPLRTNALKEINEHFSPLQTSHRFIANKYVLVVFVFVENRFWLKKKTGIFVNEWNFKCVPVVMSWQINQQNMVSLSASVVFVPLPPFCLKHYR